MEKEEQTPQKFRQNDQINQKQFFELITGKELSWQSLIYDLIKTEQLDPWNIDIGILADKYLVMIQQLEEADFFVSSKVLLACSLLLRLKSELLVNRYIQSLDEALYGKKPQKEYQFEKIEIDEDELPQLIPRTPTARHKKVTLDELMSSLNKAMETENRRIKKEIKTKQAQKSANIVLPKATRIPLKTRIRNILFQVKTHLKKPENVHMKYSELAKSREEKIASFLPVLHLSNQKKLFLNQPQHFDEVYLALQMFDDELKAIQQEIGVDIKDFENPENFKQ